ncbi:MAG TPA: DUF3597 domain-containing protein [Noviherbaspirillum sp.]|uniref:DUF3597 domain-containing protein n=1 Tax=Noviherbaspirillum sp. TaxID=1926288 RepID=UPI002DDD6D0D|nr:DUF3597 domain-containing protein [Noviherbaspirillum sp.]HEV2612064.1 DUF3597 domain-containing protein [Noviherbaspirillum sp.]
MGMLGNIFSKIFPSRAGSNPAAATTPTATTAQAPAATAAEPQVASSGAAASAEAPAAEVDVEAVLNNMARNNPQKLNWRTSIVDLLKLLDLDSSLAARKELAQELQYGGDTNDSAAMNIWLHKQVMNKLAANGGKVPADLRD